MQVLFSVLIILQFAVIAAHDLIDIPGWVHGSQVKAVVGRAKFVIGTLSTVIFPALAAGYAVYFWSRPKPVFVKTYWVAYCAITVASAAAMWYIPYFFGTSDQTRDEYKRMYEGTKHILPARGDNPRPNIFHIVLHVLFATTMVLAILLRLRVR